MSFYLHLAEKPTVPRRDQPQALPTLTVSHTSHARVMRNATPFLYKVKKQRPAFPVEKIRLF